MKIIILLLLSLLNISFGQTKLFINKTDGTSDSLLLAQIKSITFKSADTTTTLTQGLMLYYPLNGKANDSSGNHYHGIVYGATPTKNRFSKDSSAMSFNGINSWISCGDILDNVFNAQIAKFTVVGWAKVKTVSWIGGFVIGKNGGGLGGPYEWNVTCISNNVIYGAVFSDTAAKNYIADTSHINQNQWFHFALTFDGSNAELQRIKLYVNGSLAGSGIYNDVGTLGTGMTKSSQHLTIGANHISGQPTSPEHFFDGDLDEIRIYNRALNAGEIQALYSNQD